jgi:signal transduction histidine kinase/DNA-binding response OmpR family regulator
LLLLLATGMGQTPAQAKGEGMDRDTVHGEVAAAFILAGSNHDGKDRQNFAPVVDAIQAPIWLTWWAKLAYIVIAIGGIAWIAKIRKEWIHMKRQLILERMAREQEHRLTESKMFFFTNISHELRTPLSLILMPLEKIAFSNDVPLQLKNSLSTAHKNASNLMKLVNELMDVSKFDEMKPSLRVQHGEYVSFITEVAECFKDAADKKNISLSISSSLTTIRGWYDADKLDKIVRNLLANAFKFTNPGGEIKIKLQLAGSDQNAESQFKQIELTVADTGIGIAAEELPRIFDKFYQAKCTSSISHTGSGIGLSLTKTLVDVHHGSISVESTPGVGTKFYVRLPIDQEAYKKEEFSQDSNTSYDGDVRVSDYDHIVIDENLGKPELLIIEDNDELRSFLAAEFSMEFSVTEASTGEQGLAIARERAPDLIVSDIVLPGKSGLTVCKEMKNEIRTSHVPIILLSAKASTDDQIAGLETGADVYIAKPFSIRVLRAQIKQIISVRRKLFTRYSQDAYLMPASLTDNTIDKEFLQKAIDYINNNLHNSQLSVESIAELFNISRSQVYRKIKALTGQTVVEFIRMVRLKYALSLMEEKKFNLSEVADRAGFNSLSYFTRSFKEQYGKAPSEYLEKRKTNES